MIHERPPNWRTLWFWYMIVSIFMNSCGIIILNWNGREHLDVCLSSVLRMRDVDPRVILVDNGSHDGSVAFARERFPDIEIIETGSNVGFAEGNNVAIRSVLKDRGIKYVAVLNNDTEVDQHWLASLTTAMDQDERIGAVAGKMMNYYQKEIIDSTGDFLLPDAFKVVTRGSGEHDHGQYDRPGECFSARAGAALYRREMLEDICLDGDYFDSHYFAYIEDTDLSIRARLRGWRIVYAPEAVVYHKVSATTKKMSVLFQRFHTGRNRLYTAIKDLPIRMWPVAARGYSRLSGSVRIGRLARVWLWVHIIGSIIWAMPRLLRQRRLIQSRRTISIHDILDWQKKFSIIQNDASR